MLAMLLGTMLASTAPESALHARWRACTNTKSNNDELGMCATPYLKAADAQLNATWKQLMAAVATSRRRRPPCSANSGHGSPIETPPGDSTASR